MRRAVKIIGNIDTITIPKKIRRNLHHKDGKPGDCRNQAQAHDMLQCRHQLLRQRQARQNAKNSQQRKDPVRWLLAMLDQRLTHHMFLADGDSSQNSEHNRTND